MRKGSVFFVSLFLIALSIVILTEVFSSPYTDLALSLLLCIVGVMWLFIGIRQGQNMKTSGEKYFWWKQPFIIGAFGWIVWALFFFATWLSSRFISNAYISIFFTLSFLISGIVLSYTIILFLQNKAKSSNSFF